MRYNKKYKEEYESLIRPIKVVSQIVSIWPLARNSGATKKLFRTYQFYAIVTMETVTVAALILDTIRHLHNMDAAIECALMSTSFLLAAIRLLIYRAKQEDMLYVVETMRSDWLNSPGQYVETIRNKCLSGYRLSKFFIISVYFTMLSFIFLPVLEMTLLNREAKNYPFHGDYYFFNETNSGSPIFECLYVFNSLSGAYGCSIISGATTFNLVTVIHASAKFSVVRRILEDLKSQNPNARGILRHCVKLHQDAIIFADTCERVINLLALMQFITGTGMLCFAGFQLTAIIQEKKNMIKYGAFLISATTELFIFSLSGQKLIDESVGVGDSAYNGAWSGCEIPKSLRIIMMRSRKNSKITAAKFYDMSFRSFTSNK
ncbi:putative odorant receptor 92a isoform X2 [Prorops nasuta]|uniref:putative odorant receptor 92a isoform X2 n=1 Tax=Prorops nasuta TaxID=863751 RepID=UPI0034CF2CBB